jgi:outer membrane PBP1 activator LpoA protein
MLLLGALLSGLCLSTSANTTAVDDIAPDKVMATELAPDASGTTAPFQAIAPSSSSASTAGDVLRFTVLLPLQSESLGNAANVVRAGFLAAYQQDKIGVAVTIIEISDTPEEVVSSYTNALATSDVMIGPLTRSSAAAIAQSGAVRKPTISLTQSDVESATSSKLPPLMLAMGLSVEDEARQTVAWIASGAPVGKVLAVSTSISWQRRAAKAFAATGKLQGLDAEVVELGSASGYLSAADLAQLKKRLQTEKIGALFAALDAAQARQMRVVIGNDIPIYGTAQLNPLALSDWVTAEPVPNMNGVRLLDIPWQLQADHPAVMIYPRMVVSADQRRSADMERLYALGIDAFRVARLVAAQRKQFEIDGVTGKLTVGFNKDGVYFERTEPRAIYRDGVVAPFVDGR